MQDKDRHYLHQGAEWLVPKIRAQDRTRHAVEQGNHDGAPQADAARWTPCDQYAGGYVCKGPGNDRGLGKWSDCGDLEELYAALPPGRQGYYTRHDPEER